MAHVRCGTLAPTIEWARHLRPTGKRAQAHLERQAVRRHLVAEVEDFECDCEPGARYDSPMREQWG